MSTQDQWPVPQGPAPGSLPRVEDLPRVEGGYEQEAVREAFDSFYRHAAQLDATLRVLESVEAFGRRSRELQADLRRIRAAGWAPQPWSGGQAYVRRPAARELPDGATRWAVEALFLILVAIAVGLARFGAPVIVGAMGGAFLIVLLVEVASASRPVYVPRRLGEDELEPGPEQAPTVGAETVIDVFQAEPEREVEPEPEPGGDEQPPPRRPFWRRSVAVPVEPVAPPDDAARHVRVLEAEEPEEQEPVSEAVVEEPEPVAEAEPGPEAEPEAEPEAVAEAEPEPVSEAVVEEPEQEAEPESGPEPAGLAPPPRRRFWRRRHEEAAPAAESPEPAAEARRTGTVRVLASEAREPDPDAIDPWEVGFDLALPEEPPGDGDEPPVRPRRRLPRR